MGALNGSSSYLRFLVDGDVPAPAVIEKAIEARRFLPLSPTADVMESCGWVPVEAPFDDEMPITRDVVVFGDILAIAYREDAYRIPRALLKRETAKLLAALDTNVAGVMRDARSGDGHSRAFIKSVEQSVLVDLKAKTIPRSKIVDVVWTGAELRVFASGTIATERVCSLFERTFQVRAEVASYAARAFTVDLSPRDEAVLDRLSPAWLFPDAIRRDPEVTDAG